MVKVQIYGTQTEMWQQQGENIFNANLRTRETLDDLYENAMLEYKEKSGFNERFLEAQKKNPQRSTFSPDEVHLPTQEQEKFNEQYQNLGKGLELTLLVNLYVVGDKYSFHEGNSGDIPHSFTEDAEYENIASLVQGVKDGISSFRYFGVTFPPVFYTTREETALVPEQISNNPEDYLQGINKELAEIEEMPAEYKELFVEAMKDFASCKDKIRGLTEEECLEFERLYQK